MIEKLLKIDYELVKNDSIKILNVFEKLDYGD